MKKVRRKKQNGGLLIGNSHNEGGIPAIVDGSEMVELEGGEYIVQRKAVQTYGVETIAKINQGLVSPEKLKELSKGGFIEMRRQQMRQG